MKNKIRNRFKKNRKIIVSSKREINGGKRESDGESDQGSIDYDDEMKGSEKIENDSDSDIDSEILDHEKMKMNHYIGTLFRIMMIISATLYILWLLQFHPTWYQMYQLYY